jgi:hypothetical protein
VKGGDVLQIAAEDARDDGMAGLMIGNMAKNRFHLASLPAQYMGRMHLDCYREQQLSGATAGRPRRDPEIARRRERTNVSTERWPETSVILKMLTPPLAADVRNPARNEWPANDAGSSPTRSARAFTISATDWSDSRAPIVPPLRIERNSGPAVIAAASHHGRDRTGDRAAHNGERSPGAFLIGFRPANSDP